ncbi:MAG TPA: MFS transporter [Candidatus Mediterraneibacter tabaqchaliae]|uniref:MFS transporter n=1 Tax=Candidatus Mediterraneibacter tabaqchaliae TaxID=2838689 RepID=A0A9D2R6N1_9FIRM|nr:MFS transporter [Candidatus Mediterraneibacter tabaqchaliae]
MKFKLTSLEKKWVLYDVGNSAFTMMVSTIFPIYFNFLAGNAGISDVDYLAYWGYATSICTLLVAILGPTLGAVADTKNFKKTIFCIAMGVGVFGCILLGFLSSWIWFLGVFVLAKTGYSASLVFYDAMLTDVTEPERMDTVSSHGYAWGYIGSCIPFVACLGIVLGGGSLGMDMQTSMILAFLITALWWLFSSVPLLRSYRQRYFAEAGEHVVRNSFQRLGRTFAELVKQKQIFVFLLAFFFYIDGVYTVIDMATAYGQALGLDSTGLLLALLVTQIVAFPSVLIFSRIIKNVSPEKIITICIAAYFCIAVYAYWLDSQLDFWILAVLVGMFQGTIQALSRSYFAKIIPAEKSGEYFGIYDICGKGASVLGTALVSFLSQVTGSINIGVSALSVMFLIGLVLFQFSARLNRQAAKEQGKK